MTKIHEDEDLKEWRRLNTKWQKEDLWLEDWYDSLYYGANTQEPENFPVCGLCGESVDVHWPQYWFWCEWIEKDGMWLCGDCIRALNAAKKCEDLGINCPDILYCPTCKSIDVWYGWDSIGSPEHYHCRQCGFSFC